MTTPTRHERPLTVAVALAAVAVLALAGASSAASTLPSWSGVAEIVNLKLAADGSISGAPKQKTVVTASNAAPYVEVPVSSKPHNFGKGRAPAVNGGAAQFAFDKSGGTTTQTVTSKFTKQIPVSVTPTYELNGQSVSADQLRRIVRKSGVLHVTYELANITNRTTTVSYEGFNGAQQTSTVTMPLPLVAQLTVTFPRDTSGLEAPGAELTPDLRGVNAKWTLALAPPLGPATQSVSYSLNVKRAVVAKASLILEPIVPATTPTGQMPNRTAAAIAQAKTSAQVQLGQAETSAATALQQVQAQLSQLSQTQTRSTHDQKRTSFRGVNGVSRSSQQSLRGLAERLSSLRKHGAKQIAADVLKIKTALNLVSKAASDHTRGAHLNVLEAEALAKLVADLKTHTGDLRRRIQALAGGGGSNLADAVALKKLIGAAVTDLRSTVPGAAVTE